ncbi:MAG: hypothetical protein HZC28_12715 [Spirochaetes bacterium]|nr:hypothetical protein [Spirochaetota bacterium]
MGSKKKSVSAWVVTANMGLGHLRAAWALRHIAEEGIITVGYDKATSPKEAKQWKQLQGGYEFLSRLRMIPLIGKFLFKILDSILYIPPLYPMRDLSHPSMQVHIIQRFIRGGLCRGMLEHIATKPLPLVTPFYAPALAADMKNVSRPYCIICDADANRAWVAADPKQSRIVYFAPCGMALRRLKEYGVPDERIYLTGFPLPTELLGDENLSILKNDLSLRLRMLDPYHRFWPLHGKNVAHFLGVHAENKKPKRVLTVTFAVGGAGAQAETGAAVARSLAKRLHAGEIALNLVAGVRVDVNAYFMQVMKELGNPPHLHIVFSKTHEGYFTAFNAALRTTDILWTKPSELSFYSALGLPMLLTEPIGSHEEYNRRWLFEIQAGLDQYDPRYTSEWLFDLLAQGRLAEASWAGFLKARKCGTYKIIEVLRTGDMRREYSPLKR